MKKIIVSAIFCGTLLSVSHASPNSGAELDVATNNQRYEIIDGGVSFLDNLRAGAMAFYIAERRWPNQSIDLYRDKYVGATQPSWGSFPIFTDQGNSLLISLPVPSKVVARGIASKIGATLSANHNTVQLTLPTPQSASIGQNYLSRVAGDIALNTMQTSLNMGANDINNVSNIDASQVNADKIDVVLITADKATLNDVEITGELEVFPDANFRRNVNVAETITSDRIVGKTLVIDGGANIAGPITTPDTVVAKEVVATHQITAPSLVINGGTTSLTGDFESLTATGTTTNILKVNGAAEFIQQAIFKGYVEVAGALTVGGIASAMDIKESGVFLRDKYLAINDTATNADELGGIEASRYARRDTDNTFTGRNNFANGVWVDDLIVVSDDGRVLYQDGIPLNNVYLGKTAKAADTALLEGKTKAQVVAEARTGLVNQTRTINGHDLSADITLNAADVGALTQVTADGRYLGKTAKAADSAKLEGKTKAEVIAEAKTGMISQATADGRYLGIDAKATDADMLDGLDSSQFARTDVAEQFNSTVTAKGRIYADAGLHVRGDWVRVNGSSGLYFESYGGGWHMQDTTLIRAYGGKSIYTTGYVRGDGGLQVDGKWIASADGNTLYENNVALSSKYLGKTAKASSAVTADKLGGVAASSYARRDIANTFAAVQTFNGGLTTSGNATINGSLLYKDHGGTTRNMKDTHRNVDSLLSWQTACRKDVTSDACGIELNNGGGGTVVWSGSSQKVYSTLASGIYAVRHTNQSGMFNMGSLLYVDGRANHGNSVNNVFGGTTCDTSLIYNNVSSPVTLLQARGSCNITKARILEIKKLI